jgi:hypothetical protein
MSGGRPALRAKSPASLKAKSPMSHSRLLMIMCVVLSAFYVQTGVALSGEQEPLRCELVRDANLIKCEALVDGVNVSDASINGGKCRSPLVVYEYNMRMVKQLTGAEASGISDFRRAYKAGETFSLYIDKECAAYEYTVTVNGASRQYKVKS